MNMEDPQKFFELLKKDHRFSLESYRFVNDALTYAQNVMKLGKKEVSEPAGEVAPEEEDHVTGQDLCVAVCKFALEQYGYMAKLVLHNLGIRKTGDIGDIVYNMIDIGCLRRAENDRREDFDNVFDLAHDLENGFQIDYKKSPNR